MNTQENKLKQKIEELEYQIKHLKSRKKYGLVWEDKLEEFEIIAKNAFPILKAKNDNSYPDINVDIAGGGVDLPVKKSHILIEGDNYHALSILSYTHKNKIDVIYIDPPYNTGNKDFKYNDSFVDKEDSFRHSKWLSFMAKRLRLAKGLLADDGVIFISIDDNEQAQLKLLCDEVFGEKNFIEIFIVRSNPRGNQAKKHTASEHEFIFCYSKNKGKLHPLGFEKNKNEYNKKDDCGHYREMGLRKRGAGSRREYAPNQYFPIFFNTSTEKIDTTRNHISDIEIIPKLSDGTDGRWRWSKKSVFERQGELLARLVRRNNTQEYDIFQKDYFYKNKIAKIKSILYEKEVNYENATEELKGVFGSKVFDYPKPTYLIKKILSSINSNNLKVLDFMAGSGTTGHAVLELNKQDGGNRQFILCTNNENDICEQVTYERIKRVMQGYTTLKGKKIDGLGGRLKYLKTDFVKKQKTNAITDEDKIKLTYQVGCVLALKENTFNEVKKAEYYQIFSSFEQLTAIYFSENKADLSELVEFLATQDKCCKLYVFSWTKGEYKHEFSDYSNIIAEDIPEPILDVYKSIGIV